MSEPERKPRPPWPRRDGADTRGRAGGHAPTGNPAPPEVQALAERVDKELDADRRYFARRRRRRYRLRRAFPAEAETFALLEAAPPEGWRTYVAVKLIADGARMRIPFYGPPGLETDISEGQAADIFAALAPRWVRDAEAGR